MSEAAVQPPREEPQAAADPVRVRRSSPLGLVGQFVPGAPAWLVTFTDLVALLVTFFAMMLSMSAFEEDALAALSGRAGQATLVRTQLESGAGPASVSSEQDAEAGAGARYLANVLRGQLATLGAGGEVTLAATGNRATLTLPARLIENPLLRADLYAALERMANAAPGRVTVFASVSGVDAQSWSEAIAALDARAGGVAVGAAGWLGSGEAAIVIRDPSRGSAR